MSLDFKEFKKIWDSGVSQPEETLKDLMQLYRRNWADSQPLMPGEIEGEKNASKEMKRPLAHGLVYYLVRMLSQLYSRPVVRTSDDSDILQELYWKGLDHSMEDADTWSRLFGTALLGLYMIEDEDGPKIFHFAVAPMAFRIFYDNDFSKRPSAIMVKVDESVYHYWTDESFVEVNKEFDVISKSPNPIGRIPFVTIVTDRDPDLPGVGIPFGGLDVVENAMAVARLLRELGWTASLQRGQPWTNSENAEIAIGPDYVIRLKDSTEKFEIASNNANITGMLSAFQELLSQFLVGCGLTPDLVVGSAMAAQSGVAIALHRADIRYDRERRAGKFREVEKEAISLVNMWLSQELATTVDATQTVVYPPIPLFRSATEMVQVAQILKKEGLSAEKDFYRDLMPDLSDADIDLRMERAKEEKEARILENPPPPLPDPNAPVDEDETENAPPEPPPIEEE